MTDRSALLNTLGIAVDEPLLTRALTHRSFAYENGGLPTNERLEFLGDSVLGFVVAELLYNTFDAIDEGELSRRRAALVSTTALADRAIALGVGQYLLLGRGEELTGGHEKPSLLADVMESLIGATLIAQGFDAAKALVLRIVSPLLPDIERLSAALDPKTSLLELCQSRGLAEPHYTITASGPDHDKSYSAQLTVGDSVTTTGTGSTKKHAEAEAALAAWHLLQGVHA